MKNLGVQPHIGSELQRIEEALRHQFAPMADANRLRIVIDVSKDLWKIDQHPAHVRSRLQDFGEQRAITSTDISYGSISGNVYCICNGYLLGPAQLHEHRIAS